MGCAAIGLAPWLLTGARLPLQNLWADQSDYNSMPHALLPWSQYAITQLWGALVVGWLVAGAAWSLGRGPHAHRSRRASAVGVLAVQLLAVCQTVVTVAPRLVPGSWSVAYMAALLAVCIAAGIVGLVTFWLVTSDSSARVVVGWCLSGPSIAWWFASLWYPLIYTGAQTTSAAHTVVLVVPGLVTAGVVARVGVRGGLREAATWWALVLGIGVAWLLRAGLAGVQAAVGSRALLRHPLDLAAMGGRAFWLELTDLRALALPLAGVAVGALVACAASWARRD